MMQPVVIRLPEEDKRHLELEAKSQGVSLAEVARTAIRVHLKKRSKKKNGAQVLLEWGQKANKYPSSEHITDLSTNYKQYLYGPKSKKFGYLWKKNK